MLYTIFFICSSSFNHSSVAMFVQCTAVVEFYDDTLIIKQWNLAPVPSSELRLSRRPTVMMNPR